jgi:hypothetical protein
MSRAHYSTLLYSFDTVLQPAPGRSIPSPLVNHLSENGTDRSNRVDSLLNTHIHCFVFVLLVSKD